MGNNNLCEYYLNVFIVLSLCVIVIGLAVAVYLQILCTNSLAILSLWFG